MMRQSSAKSRASPAPVGRRANPRQRFDLTSDGQQDDDWRQVLLSERDIEAAAAAALEEYQRDHLIYPETLRASTRSSSRRASKTAPATATATTTTTTTSPARKSKSPVRRTPSPRSPVEPPMADCYEVDENELEHDPIGADDNSSLSFAQSGCHSILSAWRIKSANRAARASARAAERRPTSVLSNASSAGKKSAASTAFTGRGKSPASQTRIPLGPRAAQQFVTNSRRRRRANELVLSTLEAQRRAVALNRQNVASLWGSESYLADGGAASPFQDDYLARLSLSPSPVQQAAVARSQLALRSPSPLARPAISDLGARQKPANVTMATRQANLAARTSKSPVITRMRPPPLAKLDQNSSDLCSSNSSSSSSSSSDSSSSDSSESQFTRLVASERAPDCVLLDEQALRRRRDAASPQLAAPKPPERQRRPQAPTGSEPAPDEKPPTPAADDERGLRRGALNRDSVRRYRLSKQQQQQQQSSSEAPHSSSDSSSPNLAAKRQALSPLRKKLIEESAFPNRQHFRTSSARGDNLARHRQASPVRRGAEPQQARPLERSKSMEPDRSRPRSSSSENLRPPRGQTPRDEVKRVEQMLRQMRPNQVFTSYARESQTLKSQSMAGQTEGKQTPQQPTRQPLVTSQQGSRSTSDARFDALGNRRQHEIEEHWRHEETSSNLPGQRVDRRTTSERYELMRSSSISPPAEFADRRRTRPASPVARPSERQQKPQVAPKPVAPPQSSSRWPHTTPIEPATRGAINLEAGRPTTARRVAETSAGQRRRAPEPVKRAQSEERPPVAARSSKMPTPSGRPPAHQQRASASLDTNNDRLPKFERTADDEFRKRVDYLRRLARANLSEPLAVKQQQQPQRQQQSVASRKSQPPTLTKPMTTNWSGLRQAEDAPDSGSGIGARGEPQQPQHRRLMSPSPIPAELNERLFNDDRWRTDPLAAQPRARVASTNLDLLADRYQSREQFARPAAGIDKWRRSNSSIASLGSTQRLAASSPVKRVEPKRAQAQYQHHQAAPRRSLSPPAPRVFDRTFGAPEIPQSSASHLGASRSQLGSDLLATRPRSELTSSAVVKLVVRERSAPKLDYAIVEQQPVVQHVQHMAGSAQQTPGATGRYLERERPQDPGNKLPIKRPLLAALPEGSPQQQQQQQQVKTPLRIASPRSPDYGPMAASSNDDSAIASSVSSPSLSYMIPGAPGNLAPTTGSVSPTVLKSAAGQQPLQSAPTSRNLRQTAGGETPAGVLQSILRRQHLQQQQQLFSGDSSDSSARAPQSFGAAATSSSSPDSGQTAAPPQVQVQAQAPRPQEPLFRSDARSPEPSGAADFPEPAASGSGVGKRVHFNDRTSIRSFESISSLAGSDSTAIPNEMLARQQVGSPDSAGSGSTSRLSAESPDMRRGNGAAIYAIRGDPELELQQHQAELQQHQQVAAMPQVRMLQQAYTPVRYIQQQQQQQQQHQQPQMPFIRMTAPPTITTNTTITSQAQPPMMGSPNMQQLQYVARPTSATTTQIVPTMATIGQQQSPRVVNDDEDFGYTLRLRQAATSRAFNYVGPMQPQPPQAIRRPPVPAHGLAPAALTSGNQAQPQQPQQQQQQQQSRRNDNLSNYQTEV